MNEVVFGVIILALIAWHFLDRKERDRNHNEALAQARSDYLAASHEQTVNDEATIDHLQEVIKDLSKEHQGDTDNTAKLINALIAKTTAEVRDLNLTDKIGAFQHVAQPEVPPDMVPVEQLSQDEWEQHVLGKQPEGEEEVK